MVTSLNINQPACALATHIFLRAVVYDFTWREAVQLGAHLQRGIMYKVAMEGARGGTRGNPLQVRPPFHSGGFQTSAPTGTERHSRTGRQARHGPGGPEACSEGQTRGEAEGQAKGDACPMA